MEVYVAGRNEEKMVSDVNIVRVASLIRNQNRTNVVIRSDVDLEDVDSIARCLEECRPDIIVNSSRAYPGLKYGCCDQHILFRRGDPMVKIGGKAVSGFGQRQY